jgi:lysozyme
MNISDIGVALIKKWEGCALTACLEPVGVATIGYGCIAYPNGRPVRLGDQITQEQADALLINVSVNQNQRERLMV